MNINGQLHENYMLTMNKDEILVYIRERYTYDAETGIIRHKGKDRPVKGTINSRGYLKLGVHMAGYRKDLLLHRMAWALFYGRWPTQIDHINGNPTDNRLCNLREVSSSENNANRMWPWKPNARTGLPGVCERRTCKGKFLGYILGSIAREFAFSDKYEAFFVSVMLGHMFSED